MAALDRAQTIATQRLRNAGHTLSRNWRRDGKYVRINQCLRCKKEFRVLGYISPYGISARYGETITDKLCKPNNC